jgi:hypothetical protein
MAGSYFECKYNVVGSLVNVKNALRAEKNHIVDPKLQLVLVRNAKTG